MGEAYQCERCGGLSAGNVHIVGGNIKEFNSQDLNFMDGELCKQCSDSFRIWWKQGKKKK